MNTTTPFFAGFHRILFGRIPRPEREKLTNELQAMQQACLCQLAKLCRPWIPTKLLRPAEAGTNSRRRHYPADLTFWAFLSQVMSPGSPCRETVRKVQAWYASRHRPIPDSGTSAYCQARARLPEETLQSIYQHTATELQRRTPSDQLWCNREVKVVDGTGVSMPDTPENQRVWPQSGNQRRGCGFPVAKLVGCFSLASGALLGWVEGTLRIHESRLFQKLFSLFCEGDIVLVDRGFCSFGAIADLLARGVDSVMRQHQARPIDWRKGKRLGKKDRLVTWEKPRQKPKGLTKRQWSKLPRTLTLRLLHIQVTVPGFRPESIVVVTTLTDPVAYPAEQLAELYLRRWSVELFFRDIKITLGLDVLRCQTPAMVRKEIIFHAIVYNLIRALMQQAACLYRVDLSRISFKGTVDTLRQWSDTFSAIHTKPREQSRLFNLLLMIIADDLVPYRPHRSEPRVRKRRPKNYRLMTRPRHENSSRKSSQHVLI